MQCRYISDHFILLKCEYTANKNKIYAFCLREFCSQFHFLAVTLHAVALVSVCFVRITMYFVARSIRFQSAATFCVWNVSYYPTVCRMQLSLSNTKINSICVIVLSLRCLRLSSNVKQPLASAHCTWFHGVQRSEQEIAIQCTVDAQGNEQFKSVELPGWATRPIPIPFKLIEMQIDRKTALNTE